MKINEISRSIGTLLSFTAKNMFLNGKREKILQNMARGVPVNGQTLWTFYLMRAALKLLIIIKNNLSNIMSIVLSVDCNQPIGERKNDVVREQNVENHLVSSIYDNELGYNRC